MRLPVSRVYAALSIAATAYVAPVIHAQAPQAAGALSSDSTLHRATGESGLSIVGPAPSSYAAVRSRVSVGSRVRIDYVPLHSVGVVRRSQRTEGVLRAVDSTRFTLELPHHESFELPREQALSIAVRERVGTRATILGATLFGVGASIIYTEGLSRAMGRERVPKWQYAVGPLVGGGMAVLGGHHWVPTTFPP